MKQVEKKDAPAVSGGYYGPLVTDPPECPIAPEMPPDYPQFPNPDSDLPGFPNN
jgi:hypothetical protein